jgi:hypothetical protein
LAKEKKNRTVTKSVRGLLIARCQGEFVHGANPPPSGQALCVVVKETPARFYFVLNTNDVALGNRRMAYSLGRSKQPDM